MAQPLGLRPVAPAFLLMLAAIVATYIAAAEVAKRFFYDRSVRPQHRREDGRGKFGAILLSMAKTRADRPPLAAGSCT